MSEKEVRLTPQLMAEIFNFTNHALAYAQHMALPAEGDAIFDHIRNLKFPLRVMIVGGKAQPGLQSHPDCYSLQMRPHMQAVKPIGATVCAVVLFAWMHELDVSVIVYDEDEVGFAFSPGEGPDDVFVTPSIRAPQSKEAMQ